MTPGVRRHHARACGARGAALSPLICFVLVVLPLAAAADQGNQAVGPSAPYGDGAAAALGKPMRLSPAPPPASGSATLTGD
eukprot:4086417-Prymnesium_polylepis.1